MTQYITTYKSPFWDDPRVQSTLDTSIPRLPPRPEHLKPWMISSLSGCVGLYLEPPSTHWNGCVLVELDSPSQYAGRLAPR